MKILLVSPKFRNNFWNWQTILPFVGKKAAFFPLGLLTVAGLLPDYWEKKFVDLNVRPLSDEDLERADLVLISAMTSQKDSAMEIGLRCRELGVQAALGGPVLELESICDEFPGISHFFFGKAEASMPQFLADMEVGAARRIYRGGKLADINKSPIPLFGLADPAVYVSGILQYSVGCPFHCTFCSEALLDGRNWQAKSPSRFLTELELLRRAGFHGHVQIADANFIGKPVVTENMLESELIPWQKANGYPFDFTVEAPVILADRPSLMEKMVQAGIRKTFLGLETASQECLKECGKVQNMGRDLVADVKKIQNFGLVPMSGYIVGFDSEPPTFAEDTIKFIQDSGVALAMVDALQAQPGTELYKKLESQGRLSWMSVSNTDSYPNFVSVLPAETIAQGHRKILETIYSPKEFCRTVCNFLKEYGIEKRPKKKMSLGDFKAFMRANLHIGLLGGPKTSFYYWKSLLGALFSKKWRALADVIAFQIYGVHLRAVTKEICKAKQPC